MSREERTWIDEKRIKGNLVLGAFSVGHTQLICSNITGMAEADKFLLISPIIARAIEVFSCVLIPQKLHDFRRLSLLTNSQGRYIKTLILRVSTEEESDQYKVHLVPFFSSQKEACRKNFQSLHSSVLDEENGGLLAWLGAREIIIDSWQMVGDNPFSENLERIANEEWLLQELAGILAKTYHQKRDGDKR